MNLHTSLITYVLEKAEQEPLKKRAELYRGLAIICGDPHESATLVAMADNLEEWDSLCREFNFSFNQENSDNNNET